MTDDAHPTPKVRDELVFRSLDDEWVVYDPHGQQLHVMNRTAAIVWLCCTGELTLDDIAGQVSRAFDDQVPLDQVERDVTRVLDEFAEKGLLE